MHLHLFIHRGWQILSDVIGANRKLAMAAINQRSELDTGWPPKRVDRVHGRTNGAASVENVIDNDDSASFQRHWKLRRTHNWQFRARSDIVAVHRHVDHARLEVDLFDLVDKTGDALRNLHAARGNSCEHDFFKLRVPLDDFVRNPPKRPTNCLRVHDSDGG